MGRLLAAGFLLLLTLPGPGNAGDIAGTWSCIIDAGWRISDAGSFQAIRVRGTDGSSLRFVLDTDTLAVRDSGLVAFGSGEPFPAAVGGAAPGDQGAAVIWGAVWLIHGTQGPELDLLRLLESPDPEAPVFVAVHRGALYNGACRRLSGSGVPAG